MTATFEKFKPLLIPLEGDKLTNIPEDSGGLTRYGISQVMHPEIDVANLTLDKAYNRYEKNYRNLYKLNAIDSQDIANKLMSFLINMNPNTAIKILQHAINHCGGNVVEDGVFGVATTTYVNTLSPMWLLDRFRIEGALFYLRIVKEKPSQIKFLVGWCKRALE